ncbi:MAG TPA: C39 family peptidase [Candidatus Acidoferrum sp.]|nr:C39 family peptidase [Candidatus Acidoferrum sp.]
MITDLFVVTSGIDADIVARAIPPSCRRESTSTAAVTASDAELLLEFPEWRPRAASRHLVPSLSVLTDVPYALRFEVSAFVGGAWSPWVATVTIGPGAFADLPTSADELGCDVDVYTAPSPLERVRLRARLGAHDPRALAASPWIATLSASDLAPSLSEIIAVAAARMPVPALSQREEAPSEIAMRICSPTSVAMVLGYWGAATSPIALAEDVFHPPSDSYGVWPAAIRAAGRRGVAGYVLRFPDWTAAAWCLERKLPIIASVQYAAGELTDAPLRETSGHLLVLTGCDATHAFVNDPVAATAAEVPRRYRLDELQRAWLDRAGVGYVLFRPEKIRGG